MNAAKKDNVVDLGEYRKKILKVVHEGIPAAKDIGLYVLKGKRCYPVDDILDWARAFEVDSEKGVVKRSALKMRDGTPVLVSTVFLGINHRFGPGKPLLFETLIFGGPHDQDMWRYSTWGEAEKGHDRVTARLRLEDLR